MSVQAVAREVMAQRGEPTARLEDWRYVDLRRRGDLVDAPADLAEQARLLAAPWIAGADLALVLAGGQFIAGAVESPDAARLAEWTALCVHCDQAELLARSGGGLAGHLRLPRAGQVVIVDVIGGGSGGWQLDLEAAAGTVCDLVLVHLHLAPGRHAAALRLQAGRESVLRLAELDIGVESAEQVGEHHICRRISAEAGATVAWHCASAGGRLVRHRSDVEIIGAGAEVTVGGASALSGDRQLHQVVRVHHRVGNSVSHQQFKTTATDRALAGFNGSIHVVPGADGTDAYQKSDNLVLSPTARIATRPQLDILADEVKASHGATIGQPDRDELRYLRARGLSAAQAQALVIDGFVREAIERLWHPLCRKTAAQSLLVQA